jgi:hypothetical protein
VRASQSAALFGLGKFITAGAPMLLARTAERGGRRFPEERLVFAGEPAELPEATTRGDLGYGRRGRAAVAQGAPRQMHPAQQQVSAGANPQLAEHFRTSSGGYFHGMVAKAKSGELHLERTVWALRRASEPEHHRAGRGGGLDRREDDRAG